MKCKCSYFVMLIKQEQMLDFADGRSISYRYDEGRCPNTSYGETENEKAKAEFQRYYQVGRMDVLFNLVNDGMITIYDAAGFSGMTLEEAEDMLQGWREAQAMG